MKRQSQWSVLGQLRIMNLKHLSINSGLNAGRLLPLLAIVIAVLSLLSGCAAQDDDLPGSPGELIARHLDARGGPDKLAGLRVVERTGTITFHEMEPPASGSYRTCIRYPKEVVIEIEAGPIQYHHVLNGRGAFICERAFRDCVEAEYEYELELQETARHANREELAWEMPGNYTLKQADNAANSFVLSYLERDARVELVFDGESGLLQSHSRDNHTRRFHDWRQSGPVLLPYSHEDYQDGVKSYSIQLQNAVVSDSLSDWCTRILQVSD